MPGQPQQPMAPALVPTKYHDVTVIKRKTYAKARVMGVPPEEFGIERQARSIRDCGYCFHRVIRRQADLIAEGFDEQDVKSLPTYVTQTGVEELSRDTVNEGTGTGGDKGLNVANRFVRIVEHYVRMDYEGDGKTKLYRVTTGGEIGAIMKRDGKPDVVEADDIPFAAMTPVPITHRFFGRSIADLVMDIQRIKTALLRGMLDNTYLAVNQRPEVAESLANESTLDDLLVSRPGAPIRVKQAGCITWQQMPSIADKILPTMEYLDQLREWRTGVARQGQGPDPQALQNQSATAANLAYTAAQAKMKLIARIFAETGIRDLFSLLHETIRKHTSQAAVFRLRNQWVNVDPRDWKRRDDMTINVGLGSGGKSERLAQVMQVAGMQKDLLLGGKTNLVSDSNIYNLLGEAVKLTELKTVDPFFTDPKTVPPPQQAPDPKLMIEQVKAQNAQQIAQMKAANDAQQAQLKAQLELQAQHSDTQHQIVKAQADITLARQKAEFDAQLALLQHQLKQRESEAKIYAMHAKAAQSGEGKATIQVKHGADELTGPLSQAIDLFGHHLAHHTQAQTEAITAALKHANAPKRVVRGKDGKVSHVEPITQG
jgi:hypothetical protein